MFTLSNNCKTLVINIPEGNLTNISVATDVNTVKVNDISTSAPTTDNSAVEVTYEPSNALVGVIKITVTGTSNVDTFYTVGTCEIDCCIASLVKDSIECKCQCDRCKDDLLRANKIKLMLEGAKYAAEADGDYSSAVDMYNKAKALCTEVCACGC